MTKRSCLLAVEKPAAETAGNEQGGKIIPFPVKKKKTGKKGKGKKEKKGKKIPEARSDRDRAPNALAMYVWEIRSGECGRVSYDEFDDMAGRAASFKEDVLCYARELVRGQDFGENIQQYAAFTARFGEPQGLYGPTKWLRAKIGSKELVAFFGFFNMPEAAQLVHCMCKANLTLVINLAKHSKAYQLGQVSLDDQIQDGNIGLMEAVARYDPKKGYRFSTYATWWIRHEMNRSFTNTGRRIRAPVHLADAYDKLAALAQQEGLDLENDWANSIYRLAATTGWKERRVEKILTQVVNTRVVPSLDSVSEEGGGLMGVIADKTVERPDEIVEREEYIKTAMLLVKGKLEKIYPIGWKVLCLRFGLEGNGEHTVKEVADLWERTRGRIRQIEDKAFRILGKYLKRRKISG